MTQRATIDGTGVYQDNRWTNLGGSAFTFAFSAGSGISVTHTIMNPGDTPVNEGTYTTATTTTRDNTGQGAGDTGARIFTFSHDSIEAFRYGNDEGGSNDADSFKYSTWPSPYTEVYIPYEAPAQGGISFSDLVVSNVTDEAASLYATANTNLTSATVVWNTEDKGDTNVAVWVNSTSATGTTPGMITGDATSLDADTQYFYRFYGVDATTNGWSGAKTFATALTDDASKPLFTDAAASYNSVTLEWDDNADTETGYILQRSTNETDYVVVAELDDNITTHTDEGLLAETTYYYQLAATNNVNESSTAFSACVTNATTLSIPPARSLTWDPAASGGSDGNGTWLGTGEWWDGTANASWINVAPDNAIIGSGGASGTITLGTVTAGTVLLDDFTGTYTFSGGSLTQNDGITSSTNAGKVVIKSLISGAGGLTLNNAPGKILQLENNNNSYSGPTAVNGGILQLGTGWSTAQCIPGGISSTTAGLSNLEINGGNVRLAYVLKRGLGSGPSDVQITGGTSGFSHIQSDTLGNITFNNNASTEVVWGSDYFKPDVFVLNESDAIPNQVVQIQNKIDLNGATRTVACNSTRSCDRGQIRDGQGHMTTTGGRLTGDIQNSSVTTTAGLIKTGPGHLQLTANNSYDGGTTISEGIVQFAKLVSMPASGAVDVQTGTTIGVNVGGSGEWSTGTSGNGTIGGLLNGKGGQSGSTVNYSGDVNLLIGVTGTGTETYAGNIVDVGGSLGLHVEGNENGTLALSGVNTFSGDVAVSRGTLSLAGAQCLPDTVKLTVEIPNNWYSPKIDPTVEVKVGSLYFGTSAQVDGTWGSTSSLADNQDDRYFTGTGILYVNVDIPVIMPDGTVIILR